MFESAKSSKISEHIVEQIRDAILDGKLQPGDKLARERELMDVFSVSKATLREALRSLEVLGFLKIKKGASGGARVSEVGIEKAMECFTNFLHFKGISVKELFEARFVIESYIAGQAARCIKKGDLDRLKRGLEEHDHNLKAGDGIDFLQDEMEFHQILATVIGNPILMFIRDFVGNLLIKAREGGRLGQDFSKRVLMAHARIYKALEERNEKKAYEEMGRHVREVERDFLFLENKVYLGRNLQPLKKEKSKPLSAALNI
jgi:GntR family transcriptional repressor for pyruvate dehydrogenase complex